jgi:histidinol-phosphate aminotransferase
MTRISECGPPTGEEKMKTLIRDCYRTGGYVFARRLDEIARKSGMVKIARLASNENPRSPPEKAINRGCEALTGANRYPDEEMNALFRALARYHGDEYTFVTGVGMDGVIETLIRTLIDPGDRVVISTPTFSFYRLAAMAQSATVIEAPRKADYSVDPDDLVRASSEAKLTVLCSPNNPSGTVTPECDVAEILSRIEGILFLDCAYVEFSTTDYRPLMRRFSNLVIGRTMSKAFALAGARVGYAFVPPWLLPAYHRASTPFTLNTVSAQAAIGALEDHSFVEETVVHVRKWRGRFMEEIGFPVVPSGANFVMVDISPWSSDEMMRLLAEQGVIVRSCASFHGLPDHYIRVSVGEDWENERFLSAITTIRESERR